MARSTMAALISRTRTLIFDTAAPQHFSDDDIQNTLDTHRIEMRYVPLRPQPTFQSGGQAIYLDFYADMGQWEDDILLTDLRYAVLTPSVAEPIVGHWHFAAQPNGIGVRATGKVYDLYASAADLLDQWAGAVKLDFNATIDRDQYARSQKFQMIRQLADDYRKRAMPTSGQLVQGDAASDYDGEAIVYPTYSGGFTTI